MFNLSKVFPVFYALPVANVVVIVVAVLPPAVNTDFTH